MRELFTHKSSLLTFLGVFWGVFITILFIGIFAGFMNGFMGKFCKTKHEAFYIIPRRTTLPYKGNEQSRMWEINFNDLQKLSSKLPQSVKNCGGIYVKPEQQISYTAKGEDKGGGFSCLTNVLCIDPSFLKVMLLNINQGRFINEIDMQQKRSFCVVGKDFSDRWFEGDENVLFKEIQINGVPFTIVGIAQKENKLMRASMSADEDESIYIPYTTADAIYKFEGKIQIATFVMDVTPKMREEQQEIISIVKESNRVSPDDRYSSYSNSVQNYVQQWNITFFGIRILLWIVAVGMVTSSLLGVFCITLLRVKEKQQEIGILLALGSTPQKIVFDMVRENLLFVLSATILGIVFGVGVVSLAEIFVKKGYNADGLIDQLQVSFGGAIAILVIIVVGGIASGYFPTKNAVDKKVVDLLIKEE